MKRLFIIILLMILIICFAVPCTAEKSGKSENFEKSGKSGKSGKNNKNSVLNDLDIYQLGSSEFMINFQGKNLPEPELIISGDTVRFKFSGIKNNLLNKNKNKNFVETVPIILNYDIENLSGDLILNIETKRPVTLYSRNNNYSEKHTFRLTAMTEPVKFTPPLKINNKNTLNLEALFPRNEKISIELNDASLRDVFAAFGQYMNKNIIIDESFPSKTVSINFNDTMLYDAMKNFMTAYDISYRLLNKNTVVFGTEDGLSRFSGRERLGRFETVYAEPAELRERLTALINIPADKITVDRRTRSLYIMTNPEKLERAKLLIQNLDNPGRQIIIHARIFEFYSSYSRELESALDAVYSHWRVNFSGVSGLGLEYIDRSTARILRQFDASFNVIEEKGHGRTLASPSVATMDGQEAKISLTEEYPYISERDEAGNSEWSTKVVGPQLFITPNVGRDGLISMKIDISTGDVIEMIKGSNGEQMPRTSKRSVTTNALVHDGEPFVIGGLFRDSSTDMRVGIPVVSDIPLIGNLFRYNSRERNRTQTIILVVPYILDVPDVPVKMEIID